MHHKNIKLIIRKQLKQQFPDWKNLTRKNKRKIAKKVLAEVTTNYNFEQEITAPKEELLGIDQQGSRQGILNLDEMLPHPITPMRFIYLPAW